MNFSSLKRIFLRIMIFCLIAAGGIAVITVLTGSFNETFAKALSTIMLVALHSLVSFGYINISEKSNQDSTDINDLSFFHNTTFIIIILSFITSIFGVWGLIGGSLIAKLYLTYIILLFAVLHGEVLSKTKGNDTLTDTVVNANYIFMVAVVLMLLPCIYASDSVGDVYFRFVAAAGIIDAVLTLVAIILNKIYLQKHPKQESVIFNQIEAQPAVATASQTAPQKPRKGLSIIAYLIIGYLVLQIAVSLIFALIGHRAVDNTQKEVSRTPNTSTTQSTNYTYTPPKTSLEYYFVTNGREYNCTQGIQGVWERNKKPYTPGGKASDLFSFTPTNPSDLSYYCKIYL